MTIEIDPVEDELIRQAASDCLEDLRQIRQAGGVTRFVRSGNDLIRVRVSLIDQQDGRQRLREAGLDGTDSTGG